MDPSDQEIARIKHKLLTGAISVQGVTPAPAPTIGTKNLPLTDSDFPFKSPVILGWHVTVAPGD